MFKDNKDFYPTPKNLIDKMLFSLDFTMIKNILEPSAGSGNIVEALKQKENSYNRYSFDIDCIEIDQTLQHVLKGKNFRVVYNDFLTYDTMKEYDLVLMNPPFSNGCKHLLKALEMQSRNGGAVVCLLNAETLKNTCTNERIDLKRKLTEYNANIEYIQNAFLDAERKTGVEVALVKVQLPEVKRESFILDNLHRAQEQREVEETESTELIDSDFFKAIVNQYNIEIEAGINLIKEYYAMSPFILSEFGKDPSTGETIQTGGCILSLDLSRNRDKYSNKLSINGYIREVRGKYWTALFENKKFIGQLTNNLQQDFYSRVEELKDYDFSLYALNNGMIDMSYIQEQIEMTERKELLSKHESKIWQGKDGKWYTYLPDKVKGRKLIKKNSLEEVESIVINKIKEDEVDPTVSEIFHEWNDRKLELKKISDSSHHRYEKFFNRHYGEFGQKKIKSITEIMMLDFLEEQIPKYNLTAKGFSGLLGITRGFLKYAKKKGYIDFNVEDMIKDMDLTDSSFKKDIKEDYQEVFSDREVETLFDYFTDNLDIWNIGLLLMFITGMRVGELVALKHSDIHEDSIDIRRTETVYKDQDGVNHCEVKDFPKTAAGVRTIIVPSDYLWVLQKIRLINPFGEYIFVNKENQRMTTFCFRNRLYRVCKKLNIYKKSPHKIRKTYGSILLDNHVDNRFIMKQMGHTDIMCTEARYHRDRREHEEKLNIISNIPQFKAQ